MFERKKLFVATHLLAVSFAGSATADILEEVVVTAQKKEESVQDISVSVSAFSGDQLDALGLTETTEIIQQVPGLQVNAWSPNVTIFNLRGISQNNFQDNLEAPVAVYIDDAYMGSLNGISGQLFDMERTEVLRGPQGTLFGRNATGGLVHYISKGATEDELNGYVEVGGGSFDRRSVEMAIGGGLADNVRGRFAARWEEADGYIEALVPTSEDIGGVDGYALRGNLQVDFSDKLTGDFWLKYSKDDKVPTGGYVFENCPSTNPPDCDVDQFGRSQKLPGTAAGDVHKHLGNVRGFLDREIDVAQAKFTYNFDNDVELVSITNRTSLDKSYLEDGDALPDDIVILATDADYTQWSQELRLSGSGDGMRWQAGAFYLDINIDEYSTVEGAPALFGILITDRAPGADLTGLGTGFPGDAFAGATTLHNWELDSRNWSVFGQVEFDLTEDLMLTVGARWSQDDKDMDFDLSYTDDYNTTPILVDTDEEFDSIVPDATTVDYGDWAGRIALDYHVSADTLLFASINRGIKGGNFTASIGDNITAQNFKHDAEVLYSYEAGFKTDITDAAMRVNGTLFYYDYNDYQAFSLAGGAPLVENTDATVYGGELEVVWMPGDNWDFNFGLSYLDSEADEVTGPGIFGVPTPPIQNAELPNAPKLSFNYLGRYSWDLSSGNIAVQVDGAWNDDQFLELTNGPGTVQSSYNVTNLRASYVSNEEKYSVSLFARNVFDEEYKAYTLDLGSLGVTSYYAPPVTYGASFKYSW